MKSNFLKRILFDILFISIWFITLYAAPIMAADAWYVCEIEAVSVMAPEKDAGDGLYKISLTDENGAFSNNTFFLESNEENDSILSVFLIAAGSSLPVKVLLNPSNPTSMKEAQIVKR